MDAIPEGERSVVASWQSRVGLGRGQPELLRPVYNVFTAPELPERIRCAARARSARVERTEADARSKFSTNPCSAPARKGQPGIAG